VPYGSLAIPRPILNRLQLTSEDLRREHWLLTDPYLLEIAIAATEKDSKRGPKTLLSFPWSPLVADPLGLVANELEQNQQREPTVLSKDCSGRVINDWGAMDKALIMEKTVKPYFEALEKECREALEQEKFALLVTLRSFFSIPQAHEKDRRRPRPQVALGTSQERTPEGLAILAGSVFRSFGLWPQLNWPLSGAPVPPSFDGSPRLKSLGLYLNKDLYLDERTGRKKETIKATIRMVKILLNLLDQELERVASLKLARAFPPKVPSSVIKAQKSTL
jgi:hypothetical protein